MPPLPFVSGREALRAFERLGWVYRKSTSSHMIMIRPGVPANLSIPDHRVIGPGLLRDLIRTAGVSVEEFIKALK